MSTLITNLNNPAEQNLLKTTGIKCKFSDIPLCGLYYNESEKPIIGMRNINHINPECSKAHGKNLTWKIANDHLNRLCTGDYNFNQSYYLKDYHLEFKITMKVETSSGYNEFQTYPEIFKSPFREGTFIYSKPDGKIYVVIGANLAGVDTNSPCKQYFIELYPTCGGEIADSLNYETCSLVSAQLIYEGNV